ncbi:RimK family protein [Bermanella sp. WJH001]|uniref:RimK family protein n=1 Tax=Bermanella sp. WJH001 TaxID=3048005 RepID=UPI0024BE69A7|nr:RimK family protein [Bermanella sp. WJH001]MDJ1536804.1 RimK family protein [Bermanella sp. WJH001]
MYKTLIVVDNEDLSLSEQFTGVISFETYLREYPKQNEPKTRIINLCDTATYLSKGYYCSLLAEARNHTVLPSVKTINALRTLVGEDLVPFQSSMKSISQEQWPSDYKMYFGKVADTGIQNLSSQVFSQFPAPILELTFDRDETGIKLSIQRRSYNMLDDKEKALFIEHLTHFTNTVWKMGEKKKRQRWDMAILVDPEEKVPPSNKEAIAKFIKAASKYGINAQAVSKDEIDSLSYYDALFIRETTAIDHHTYRLATKAENMGLVVMDDAASILRCCNKVFLHDAFSYQKVPSLKTEVVNDASDDTLNALEDTFTYPMVLKMPEGSFSKGVYKVSNRDELKQKLDELFELSALVLAQEYLFTEFDWRIGVLNGRALFACRYLMARNHWQIYNHNAKRFFSGGFETLPTFEVPKAVLDAALKASKIIGNGLYGVDVKEVNGKAYVLEVNDNPSLDHKVEDAYLGDELYMQIMGEFHRRLETKGN